MFLIMNPVVHGSTTQPTSSAAAKLIVEIVNRQEVLPADENRLREGICAVLAGEGIERANISVAIVDDREIHDLNRRYLNHDYPTDVLSFVLEQAESLVEGEIVISADTATQIASRFGWDSADELLLYAVHGTLHLVGYDDQTVQGQNEMRERETFYLSQFGLCPRYEERGS
jgi:probable rRNA maturation factor